ncbi:hypothetical protein BP5796_13242 [Coleophoma crateriformis]|uniref:PNK3P-domain-containing protein n=1 Tax=Coleophoma crateriformis TaxID=565419 RepID=A0A3D8Q3S0_9HELO|nr:hypothetical protein BP5796_13242 [Coleophoma crateriformis]
MISWTFIQDTNGTLLKGRHMQHGENTPNSPIIPFSQTPLKIAIFDLDSTLITTANGNLHALSPTDWKWWHPSVPNVLRSTVNCNQELVIVTNQDRLTTADGAEAAESFLFKEKMDAVCHELGIKITIYAACANDRYRKPRMGVWDVMAKDFGFGKGVNVEAYLVGDGAGRKSDHSDSDVHFAENLGIDFSTPEEFFLGEKSKEEVGHKFDPKWYLPADLGGTLNYKPNQAELVILVGLPGAGKTTYYRNFLQPLGYERINEHDIGSLDECFRIAEQFLVSGKSVVVDDINTTSSLRNQWLSLAPKNNVQTYAYNFTAPSDLCLHNDSVRALGGSLMSAECRPIFARIPFRRLQKNVQKPEIDEGIGKVLDVDFEWKGSDDQLETWKKHWL